AGAVERAARLVVGAGATIGLCDREERTERRGVQAERAREGGAGGREIAEDQVGAPERELDGDARRQATCPIKHPLRCHRVALVEVRDAEGEGDLGVVRRDLGEGGERGTRRSRALRLRAPERSLREPAGGEA